MLRVVRLREEVRLRDRQLSLCIRLRNLLSAKLPTSRLTGILIGENLLEKNDPWGRLLADPVTAPLVRIVGRSDADSQLREVMLTEERLRQLYADAEKDLREKGRLSVSIGFLCGLIAAVLLI